MSPVLRGRFIAMVVGYAVTIPITLWGLHRVIALNPRTFPPDMGQFLMILVSGGVISGAVIGIRWSLLMSGVEHLRVFFSEGVRLVGRWSVGILLGWLICSWGVAVESQPTALRVGCLVVGLGSVFISHLRADRATRDSASFDRADNHAD